jgi:hypothetical protein
MAISLIVALCGSFASASASSSGGSTYSVMLENILSGAQLSTTGTSTPAFQAAFHGTKAKLIVCDDKGTDAGNLLCQHEAVQDHVVAIIAGHQVDESIASQAGIPVVGVTDGTSTVSFETSGAPALFVARLRRYRRSRDLPDAGFEVGTVEVGDDVIPPDQCS